MHNSYLQVSETASKSTTNPIKKKASDDLLTSSSDSKKAKIVGYVKNVHGGIFSGTKSTETNSSIFEKSSVSSTVVSNNIFTLDSKPKMSIFGGSTSTSTNIFEGMSPSVPIVTASSETIPSQSIPETTRTKKISPSRKRSNKEKKNIFLSKKIEAYELKNKELDKELEVIKSSENELK